MLGVILIQLCPKPMPKFCTTKPCQKLGVNLYAVQLTSLQLTPGKPNLPDKHRSRQDQKTNALELILFDPFIFHSFLMSFIMFKNQGKNTS